MIELYLMHKTGLLRILYPCGKVEYYNPDLNSWYKSIIYSGDSYASVREDLLLYHEFIGSL